MKDLVNSGFKLYVDKACETPLLTLEQECEIAERIKNGDDSAREHLIKANLRLVLKIAHEFKGCGMDLEDLVNEGNLGLMKATGRFDPSKGKFSTFASWWIKQRIKRALSNTSKNIRLPVWIYQRVAKLRTTISELEDELGRSPTDMEVAEAMDIDVIKIVDLRKTAASILSLDAPVNDEAGKASFAELIPDRSCISPSSASLNKNTFNDIMSLIEGLDERDKEILKMRFGLENREEMTLEEVGDAFGVSRERIRQLQNIALRKIRRGFVEKNRIRTALDLKEEKAFLGQRKVFAEYAKHHSRDKEEMFA